MNFVSRKAKKHKEQILPQIAKDKIQEFNPIS